MRTFAQLALLVTRDTDQRQKLLDYKLTFDDTNEDTSSEFNGQTVYLAASASSNIDLGSVDNASTLLIVAYQEVLVKLNGDATGFHVRPIPAVDADLVSSFQEQEQPGVLLLRGKVSSINISNPSGTAAAEAYVAVVGEAA